MAEGERYSEERAMGEAVDIKELVRSGQEESYSAAEKVLEEAEAWYPLVDRYHLFPPGTRHSSSLSKMRVYDLLKVPEFRQHAEWLKDHEQFRPGLYENLPKFVQPKRDRRHQEHLEKFYAARPRPEAKDRQAWSMLRDEEKREFESQETRLPEWEKETFVNDFLSESGIDPAGATPEQRQVVIEKILSAGRIAHEKLLKFRQLIQDRQDDVKFYHHTYTDPYVFPGDKEYQKTIENISSFLNEGIKPRQPNLSGEKDPRYRVSFTSKGTTSVFDNRSSAYDGEESETVVATFIIDPVAVRGRLQRPSAGGLQYPWEREVAGGIQPKEMVAVIVPTRQVDNPSIDEIIRAMIRQPDRALPVIVGSRNNPLPFGMQDGDEDKDVERYTGDEKVIFGL